MKGCLEESIGPPERRVPENLGRPETLLADNGYFSEANVMLCAAAKIEPLSGLAAAPFLSSFSISTRWPIAWCAAASSGGGDGGGLPVSAWAAASVFILVDFINRE